MQRIPLCLNIASPALAEAVAQYVQGIGYEIAAADRARAVITDQPWPDDSGPVLRITPPVRLGWLGGALARLLAAREIPVGPYRLNPAGRCLTGSGGTVSLTEKETEILVYLHAAAGPVVKDRLLAEVWGMRDGVDSHTLETHIHRLRRKIETDPARPEILLTEADGYRLSQA